MGKIKVFQVELTDSHAVYAPGQTVSGKVVLELGEDLTVKGVNIKCRGKAYVAWKEGKNEYHFDTENYLYDVLTLFGGPDGKGTLPAGSHAFPFQFALPYDIPSSFERPRGSVDCHVRYWLKAFIDGAKDEHKVAITVAAPLDLNGVENAMTPGDKSSSKDVCCLCCRRGPITARLRIDRTGLVPGDTVRAEAEVDDNTGRGTNGADIKLVMNTTSLSRDGGKFYNVDTCTKTSRGAMEPFGSDSWVGELEVPPLTPSGLPGCRIIDVQYTITLSVDVRKTPMNLNVEIPIVIGSIPHNMASVRPNVADKSPIVSEFMSEDIIARI